LNLRPSDYESAALTN